MYLGENEKKVLEEFFKNPTKKFQLRELSRRTELSLPSVRNYIKEFLKKELVEKVEEGVYHGYKSSMNDRFKTRKKLWTVRKLHETGLVQDINDKLHPDALVLFGSASRGEDIEESDIDLLAVRGEKEINLKKFEEELNRDINLQFLTEEELKENQELTNNMANGIVLSGYLVVK